MLLCLTVAQHTYMHGVGARKNPSYITPAFLILYMQLHKYLSSSVSDTRKGPCHQQSSQIWKLATFEGTTRRSGGFSQNQFVITERKSRKINLWSEFQFLAALAYLFTNYLVPPIARLLLSSQKCIWIRRCKFLAARRVWVMCPHAAARVMQTNRVSRWNSTNFKRVAKQ